MMKWNFGTGIFVAYTVFAAVLIALVIRSTTYDHSLVVEDYYAKDLAYQETIDKKQNSLNRKGSPLLNRSGFQRGEILFLEFPAASGQVEGTVQLYRPDNKRLDRHFTIELDEQGRFGFDTRSLVPGRWIVRVDWSQSGKEYLDEFDIRIGEEAKALTSN